MASCYCITALIRDFLLITTPDLEQTWNLRTHAIHLLTNMPTNTYNNIIVSVEEHLGVPDNLQYDGYNMAAVYEILMFLKAKLNEDLVSILLFFVILFIYLMRLYSVTYMTNHLEWLLESWKRTRAHCSSCDCSFESIKSPTHQKISSPSHTSSS